MTNNEHHTSVVQFYARSTYIYETDLLKSCKKIEFSYTQIDRHNNIFAGFNLFSHISYDQSRRMSEFTSNI